MSSCVSSCLTTYVPAVRLVSWTGGKNHLCFVCCHQTQLQMHTDSAPVPTSFLEVGKPGQTPTSQLGPHPSAALGSRSRVLPASSCATSRRRGLWGLSDGLLASCRVEARRILHQSCAGYDTPSTWFGLVSVCGSCLGPDVAHTQDSHSSRAVYVPSAGRA